MPPKGRLRARPARSENCFLCKKNGAPKSRARHRRLPFKGMAHPASSGGHGTQRLTARKQLARSAVVLYSGSSFAEARHAPRRPAPPLSTEARSRAALDASGVGVVLTRPRSQLLHSMRGHPDAWRPSDRWLRPMPAGRSRAGSTTPICRWRPPPPSGTGFIWQSRFGDMTIEIVGDDVFLNGDRVEPHIAV